jgi:hypothetical protein
MSQSEIPDYDYKKWQTEYFLNRLVNANRGHYLFISTGIDAPQGSLLLFQFDSQIIASAILKDIERNKNSADDYKGAYVVDTASIKIFEPIGFEELYAIDSTLKRFNQVKQTLDSRKFVEITSFIENRATAYARRDGAINGIVKVSGKYIVASQGNGGSNKHDLKGTHDYIPEAVRKKEIGDSGESAILEYEKERLRREGYSDLADRVQAAKFENDGYDIISYEVTDGKTNEIHIEVKASAGDNGFYITENEAEKFFSNVQNRIYYLCTKHDKLYLHIIDRAAFSREHLKPIRYKVDVDIELKPI